MKKTLLLLIILISTGCNIKPLKCTSSQNNTAINTDKTYKIYSKKGKIEKVKYKETYEVLDEKLNKNFNAMVNFMKSNYEKKNIPYEYTNKDNKYIFEATYSIKTISEEVFNEEFGTDTLEEYKEKLINLGYKCK